MAIKPLDDAQLSLNNLLGLLITLANSTQSEAALSFLASWLLSDAICAKTRGIDPINF